MTRVWREHDVDTIFRRAHRFVDGNELNAIGAFPVLKYKPDLNFDLIFVKNTAGTIITYSDIYQNDFAMIYLHRRFGGSDIIHHGENFVTAFPIHEFNGSEAAVLLLRPETVEVRHVGKGDIDIPLPVDITHWGDLVLALNSIDTYAVNNGFAGGFIDCHFYNDYHRIFLFKKDYFDRKPVPEWRLNHLTNFQYFFSNSGNEATVRRAHNIICGILDSCSVLTEENKQKLKNIYFGNIIYHHEGVTIPGAEAQAKIHGNGIRFDPNFLTSATLYRLTGTVFHEMTHNIGYTHPHHTDPTYSSSIPERVRSCVPTTIALTDENLDYELICEIL